ncbi:hypothetical protein, unlikely [Trypanosoma brucei gambiense DAL972]|uniref:Uncharacterized protein n=1 Tax=Trypanosoma brucei gambiense (strain MHOM/CI/86/DAL972) TaxID=679716 RepID=D0A299_TRYB9|nr:hypothetical protein, unlikely [Trypanosoma brucei gambiense DAL972]CBH15393.1 hypothetical protein, unlikely [Trypanosoma brucei gambiense DAL972]|eukprot:XP_011777657.1 hypothetical protein, unlikely [Trypanosoma brucei gambiense DAL972]
MHLPPDQVWNHHSATFPPLLIFCFSLSHPLYMVQNCKYEYDYPLPQSHIFVSIQLNNPLLGESSKQTNKPMNIIRSAGTRMSKRKLESEESTRTIGSLTAIGGKSMIQQIN